MIFIINYGNSVYPKNVCGNLLHQLHQQVQEVNHKHRPLMCM